MNNYYTYAFLREDGTPYYIGKGHKGRIYDKSGRPCKYPNDKSKVIILKKNLTEDEAFEHERYMIFIYGRKDLNEGILYNKSNGGEGASGRIHTPESIQKMRESKTGENNPSYGKIGENAFHYNKPHSEETKNKLREVNTGEKSHRYGKKHSEKTKNKMRKSALGENNSMYGRTGEDNPNYGKPLSQVTKQKLSEINKNKIWITDGESTCRVDVNDPIPNGWWRGSSINKDRIWITNGETNYVIDRYTPIPYGYWRGRKQRKNSKQKFVKPESV